MVKVAFFYVDKKEQTVNVSDGRKNKEVVGAMIESVHKNMPGAEIIQLSDNETNMIDGVDTLINFGDKPEYLMPARMEYQYKFVKNHCVKGDRIIFLDPDVIVQRDLEHVFDHDGWDIALTWRDNLGQLSEAMPFNAGVVFTRMCAASELFWKFVSAMTADAPEEYKKWYGDQIAMIETVGRDLYKNRTSDIIVNTQDFLPIRYLMLPCDTYNYSPVGDEMVRALNIGERSDCYTRLIDKEVLHFKGGLKDSMIKYWDMTKA